MARKASVKKPVLVAAVSLGTAIIALFWPSKKDKIAS